MKVARDRGFQVDTSWLRECYLALLKEDGKADASVGSRGWFENFKKRCKISSRLATNNKSTDIAERLPSVNGFHRFIRDLRKGLLHWAQLWDPT